jgi:hypothetical protein
MKAGMTKNIQGKSIVIAGASSGLDVARARAKWVSEHTEGRGQRDVRSCFFNQYSHGR